MIITNKKTQLLSRVFQQSHMVVKQFMSDFLWCSTTYLLRLCLVNADGPPGGIVDQLHIGNQLARITNAGTDYEIPITPLLVRLYVEKIISVHAQRLSLESLPSSLGKSKLRMRKL
jgi:hypothetical protein